MDTVQPPVEQQSSITSSSTPRSNLLPMILISIVMLLVGLGIGYVLFSNKNTPSINQSNNSSQLSPKAIPSPTIQVDEMSNWQTFTGKYYILQYPVTDWSFKKETDTPADQDSIEIKKENATIHGSVQQLPPKGFSLSQIINNDKEYLTNPIQESITLPVGKATKLSGIMNDKNRSNDIGKSWQVVYIENKTVIYRFFLLQDKVGGNDEVFNQILNSVKSSSN